MAALYQVMSGVGAIAAIEATSTMQPLPRASMAGSTAWVRRRGVSRLVAMTASPCAGSVSAVGPTIWTPALLMRTSIGPCTASACAIQPVAVSGSPRPQGNANARPPLHAAAIFSSRSRRRAIRVTAWPAAANSRAMASPMPDEAPVTATCMENPWLRGEARHAGGARAPRRMACQAGSDAAAFLVRADGCGTLQRRAASTDLPAWACLSGPARAEIRLEPLP